MPNRQDVVVGTREKTNFSKEAVTPATAEPKFSASALGRSRILTKKRRQDSPLVPSTRCPFPLSGPSSLLMQQGAQDAFPVILPYSSPSHSSANCTLVELVRPNHKYKNQRRKGNRRKPNNVTQCHDETREGNSDEKDYGKM